jgi:hypothetical protein
MKWGVGLFGVLLSAGIIYVAGLFGYKMGDDATDAWVWACGFGAITFAGLFGFMVAVRLWSYKKHGWCAIVVLLGAASVLISLSNGIGAVSGRMNKAQAERVKTNESIGDDRADLKRMQDERKSLNFKDTDQTAVDVAKAKADAATQARKTECQGAQDSRCIKKQEVEQAALAEYRDALQNMKTTKRAAELDKNIPALKKKIEDAGLVLKANSQGAALASLFGLPEDQADWVMTRQNFGVAGVLEALAAICLAIFEVMFTHERAERAKAAQEVATLAEVKPASDGLAKAVPMVEPLPYGGEPKAFPVPPKLRLITSRVNPLERVAEIMAEIMEPGSGKVELMELFSAYRDRCQAKGKEPIPAEFSGAVAALCKRLGIQIEDDDAGIYLLNVRLKASEKQELEDQAS